MHAPKYPILAGMARDVLPVTASTVAAESRHATRRDSLKSRATPDGTTPSRVAPRRMARLAEESRQSMWHDSALPGQLSC